MSQRRSDGKRPNRPASSGAASSRKSAKPARRATNPAWLIGGFVVVGALIALLVASMSTGGDESAEGIQETAAVTITGDPLPQYPEGQADPAVGSVMPEVEGESFDGTPVTIANDGRAKVLLFLAHW
jgi:hypothetical protein